MSVDLGLLVSAANASLDALLETDAAGLTQEELRAHTIAVHRLQSRVDALTAKVVGAFDRHGDPEGARSTAAWLAWRCHLPMPKARGELSRARALRRMPQVEAAHEAGFVTSDHVRVLAAAERAAPVEFDKHETELVADAIDLKFGEFARRVAYFRAAHDRDGVDDRAQDAFERRSWHASRTFEDTTEVSGRLDPLGGAVYRHELDRLEQQLFEQDWAEARARLGDAATAKDLRRTPEQRRADAHVLMAVRSAAKHPNAKNPRVLLSLLVGYETWHGPMSQTADGTVVSPAQVVPWLAGYSGVFGRTDLFDLDSLDVDAEVVTFDGPGRVTDVGRRQRVYRGGGRRAVEVRDLFCTHESCDVPYERCDVDHIQRWEHDGPTDQTNGRLRCPYHNPGRRRPRQPEPPAERDPDTG